METRLAIRDYSFDIHHISGKKDIVADAISRFVPRSIPQGEQDPLLALSDIYIIISRYPNNKTGHWGFERAVSMVDVDGIRYDRSFAYR